MSVYVDKAMMPYGRMYLSHMIADTMPELHAIANSLGLRMKWFQSLASHPHYDICKTKRELAINMGAIPLERRDFAIKLRELRQKRLK